MLQMLVLTNLQVYKICVFGITSQDVRVQILIWFKTFCSVQNPIFSLLCIEKHVFSGISDYFRIFQTFSHRRSLTPVVSSFNLLKTSPKRTRARVYGKYVL